MFRSALVLVSFLSPLLAQAGEQTPKELFDGVTEQIQQSKDRALAQKLAKETLDANKDVFATGDGLHYGGQLALMARDADGALKSFQGHIEGNPDSELVDASRVFIALVSMQKSDLDAADAALKQVNADKLEGEAKGLFEYLKGEVGAERGRAAMNGAIAPDFTATHVVNGPAEFTLSGQKGKVVVVDFFATWCPPCRMVVPEMVELQKKHGDAIQVVGVTKYYGRGMDFSDPAAVKPGGGKSVGGNGRGPDKLSEEDEIKVNEVFVKAFEMNYPIVFTDAEVGKTYGVQGIPTVFVIDREGKVVGSAVGSGEENHEKIIAMIEKSLEGQAGAKN